MQCPGCQHQNPETARFCMACGTTLGAACVGCGAELPAQARFCMACGQPQAATDASPSPSGAPAQEPAPTAAEASPAATREASRRQLTVLFCDLVDSTKLAAGMDPEDWRQVVRRYQKAAADVIERLDGHVAQYLGDGLLVYFGYPRAHEDDALRAVTAALELLEEIPRAGKALGQSLPALSDPLQIRIGIHTGPVVVGEMGGGQSREQLALGDSVNVAARLQAAAEPGWVVISTATRRLVQGFFFLEDVGKKSLKGLSEPISVIRVIQASGFQTRLDLAAESGLTPLVGREQEFALLLDRWEPVTERRGQGVMLSGEAGLGKSRLVRQMREELAGQQLTWLECRCSPYHENSALYPILSFLEQGLMFSDDTPEVKIAKLEGAFQAVGFPLPEVVPLFAPLLSVPLPERYAPSPLPAETQRQKTLEALVAWVLAVSAEQPVALVMEDLHWSDPSTLELLGMLIEQLSSASVLLLLTFRPEFEPPWSGRSRPLHLTLHPLTRKQTTVMIQQIVGGKPLPAVVLEQLVTKTDGVPLFIEELTKTVLESDLLRESDSVYERTDPLPELAVPATLQDSLMARLDRLGSAKEVAQLGAVLGREFPHELLAAVSPMDEPTLASAVEELAKADLLHRRGLPPRAVYTFKHALIQDTAYQSLLKGTRLEWHARVARALEERFPARVAAAPEVAARHYEEGGLAVQAIPLYLQAGEAATEQSANAEAIGHLRRGIALLEQLPEGIDRDRTELPLRVALGGPLVAAQGYSSPEVAQTYERARELCRNIGEAPELARALYGLATYYTARAQLEPALEVSQQLLGLGERSGEAAVLLVGHLIMGVSLYWRGEPSRSRKHLEQTIALYDPDQHRGLAYVYGQNPDQFSRSIVAWTDWLVGHPDAALHRAEENIAQARKDAHPFSLAFALAFGAVVPQLRGEQSEARGWVEEVLSLSEEYAFPLPLGVAKVFHGRAIADPESGDRAIEEVHQGMATLAGARTEVGGPYVLCMLAETQQRAGRLDDALASVEGALAIGVATHQHFWDADLERLRGELLLQKDAGAVEEAESAFRRGLQVAREQKARSLELRLAVRLARLLANRGRAEEARTLLAPIYDGFTEGFETQDLRDARALLE